MWYDTIPPRAVVVYLTQVSWWLIGLAERWCGTRCFLSCGSHDYTSGDWEWSAEYDWLRAYLLPPDLTRCIHTWSPAISTHVEKCLPLAGGGNTRSRSVTCNPNVYYAWFVLGYAAGGWWMTPDLAFLSRSTQAYEWCQYLPTRKS